MTKNGLNNWIKKSLMLLLIIGSSSYLFSQEKTPSILEKKEHSPRKATIYSAILPGLGQVYNKKAWKVPLVYAAIGGCLYTAIWNNQQYGIYHDELVYRQDNVGLTLDSDLTKYTDANLLELSNYYVKWRDNFYIFTALAHLLNIVDANVDAHFMNFNVSEDLSLNIKPISIYSEWNKPILGLSINLKIK